MEKQNNSKRHVENVIKKKKERERKLRNKQFGQAVGEEAGRIQQTGEKSRR